MSKFDEFNELKYKGYVGHYTKMIKEAFEAGQKAGLDWIPVSVRLPKSGINVLVRGVDEHGYSVNVTALFYDSHEAEATEETNIDYCDYDAIDDKFYLKKGWHSSLDCRTIDYAVDFEVTDWQPLPEIK